MHEAEHSQPKRSSHKAAQEKVGLILQYGGYSHIGYCHINFVCLEMMLICVVVLIVSFDDVAMLMSLPLYYFFYCYYH